jgi:CRISPR-associated protein Csh2
MEKTVKTGEILFVKSVKDGIPNRDPLADSDARRIFGEDDGRISLSDVSIKRDVRDYVLAKHKDGGPEKRFFVYIREQRTEDGKLLGRESLATDILRLAGRDKEKDQVKALLGTAFDARVFGVVYSVKNANFHQTGPVQFGWAHSLHPVETRYVQGTVVVPSKDSVGAEKSSEKGKTQGTIWAGYTLPFAVFAMPGVINATIAADTGMTQADLDLLLEALWNGTLHRQARGRGFQQPLLLIHVEYNDPFFRIGYLEDHIKIHPERDAWLGGNSPSSVHGISLNVEYLSKVLSPQGEYGDKIARIRYWIHPELRLEGTLPGEKVGLW